MISVEEQLKLDRMHRALMEMHFPYKSVSVVYQHGFHVIFSNGIRDMVTDEVKNFIEGEGFDVCIVVK